MFPVFRDTPVSHLLPKERLSETTPEGWSALSRLGRSKQHLF